MIVISSQAVVRCWALLFLVLATANLSLARPHYRETQPMLTRFCGRELPRVIDEACSVFKSPSYLNLIALNRSSSNGESTPVTNESQSTQRAELDDRKHDSLLRQCCVIGCTTEDLFTFCHVDRNQIAEVALQLRHEDSDMDWLYEFLPRFGAIHTPE